MFVSFCSVVQLFIWRTECKLFLNGGGVLWRLRFLQSQTWGECTSCLHHWVSSSSFLLPRHKADKTRSHSRLNRAGRKIFTDGAGGGGGEGGGVFLPRGRRSGALKPTLGPQKLKAITSQGENRLGSAAAPINGAGHGWKGEAMDTITDTYWGAPDPSLTFSPKLTDRKRPRDNTREEELKVQINSFFAVFPPLLGQVVFSVG